MKHHQPFDLSVKLYGLTLGFALEFYVIGLWLLLPNNIEKYSILGFGFIFVTSGLVYFALRKSGERPDERFFQNLLKAASIVLAMIILFLLALGIFILFYQKLTLSAGLIFIVLAALIFLFDLVFFSLEKEGYPYA
ncbi:hypothetical protein ACVR1I_02665 [Streptococcus cameli]